MDIYSRGDGHLCAASRGPDGCCVLSAGRSAESLRAAAGDVPAEELKWKAKIMDQVCEAKQELQAAESAIGSLTVSRNVLLRHPLPFALVRMGREMTDGREMTPAIGSLTVSRNVPLRARQNSSFSARCSCSIFACYRSGPLSSFRRPLYFIIIVCSQSTGTAAIFTPP
jgi:hypothetical protein